MSLSSSQKPQIHQGDLPLERHVHTITDRFSMANTYLIDDGKLIVVDPGSERNISLLHLYVRDILHRSITDIDLIVLTHLQHDHVAGLDKLLNLCHAPVAASNILQQALQLDTDQTKAALARENFTEQMILATQYYLNRFRSIYERRMKLIDIWLENTVGVPEHPGWRVITSPGHTPDSICLYNPFSRELLCGDTMITVEGGIPLLHNGINRRQLTDILQTLRSLHVNYLYPGSGHAIIGHQPLHALRLEW